MNQRCGWCGNDKIYQEYHDQEWGEPLYDDQALFELFILETLQAGLSWITVLKKREAYRAALDNFDAHKIAQYDETKYESLMQHPDLIKNKLKMRAIIHNAQCYLKLKAEYGSFSDWLWQYVDHQPILNSFVELSDVPTKTEISDQLSQDLKKLGFKFVGSVTIYAFMQAMGMVNDHVSHCFKYKVDIK
ncbi:DNA-3-methyladenine glycosylase I [Wohlfahrtiimonas larvae]|uniref:DNA-3-methyladenine glycosylase I n=1 Tax=Wohlfahrtiimonas larvae TaxID=1157986 RepID=A0ABP9MSH3_9GAMM|nr:DNA-3-methyladenine glycosylase I [Wohlfahrtiimonas larvae]